MARNIQMRNLNVLSALSGQNRHMFEETKVLSGKKNERALTKTKYTRMESQQSLMHFLKVAQGTFPYNLVRSGWMGGQAIYCGELRYERVTSRVA